MKLFKLIILFFVYVNVDGQTIQHLVSLDTIISFTNEQIPSHDIRGSTQITSSKNYIYLASDIRGKVTNTQTIFRINQVSHKIDELTYQLPQNKTKNEIQHLSAFAQINDTLFALSFHKSIFVLKINSKNPRSLLFDKLIEVNFTCEYLCFTRHFLFAGDIYKRKKNDPESNSFLLKYSISNNFSFEDKFVFDFEQPEFSYFYPNHWIEVNDDVIFIASTHKYRVDIYDHSFKKLSRFEKHPRDWVAMDENVLSRLNNLIPKNQPVLMIDSLSKYNDLVINRLTDFRQINDTVYFACWYDYDSLSKKKIRYLDFYKFEHGELTEFASNTKDLFIERRDTAIAKKTDYPVMFWNYNSYIGNNQIIIFKPFAPVLYINRPWNEIYKDLNKYYEKNNPVPTIFIYKFNGSE